MPDRPRAADDFDAIRARALELGLRGVGITVDVYYHQSGLTGDKYWFNAVTERAKTFFRKTYGWSARHPGTGPLPCDKWNYKPPADFVFAELKLGMTLPEDAWGKRPDRT